ncbi:MAG: gene transfer agent family protein [Pseudomonadota bacterium]
MAQAANIERGETSICLTGKTYRLRPSFHALVTAEAEIGSLIALVERASSGELAINDIVVLLHACALAGGHDVSRDAFAAAVLRAGIGRTIEPLRVILGNIMGSDGTAD